MKRTLSLLILLMGCLTGFSQITSPVMRANFGVDGDLQANYFNGAGTLSGDDWFRQAGIGVGDFIIDTNGAAAIISRYATDMAFRRQPFYRTMRYPGYSAVNGHLLLDALFYRDYHGDDSTVFASGGNKNGDSPAGWSCPVSQGIPDKNDILDIMVHVRRAGLAGSDSLWMMGGVSLNNTNGDRYFDFEMYQTDISYNRTTRQFSGYGPDAGHTSWQFDAAGNVIKPGDIIFSVEYQSSSISFIEARIWINKASLLISPAAFNWSGQFDGASSGATYGYASIQPKAAGAYFTGLQCVNNTWAGPFAVVLTDESVVTTYSAKQFVEFSVNLTKLGLDPMSSITGDACSTPFSKILVKTRSSASFSAELKDFVGPFAFFTTPKVDALTATPFLCVLSGVAEIHVVNPIATSIYEWSTPNGHIMGGLFGTSITVDTPGTYIVKQHLLSGCSTYATDTIQVLPMSFCEVLSSNSLNLRGGYQENTIQLDWESLNNETLQYFEIEESQDGLSFITIARINNHSPQLNKAHYSYQKNNVLTNGVSLYFRVKRFDAQGRSVFSNTLRIQAVASQKQSLSVFPNPVKDLLQLEITAENTSRIRIDIVQSTGKIIHTSFTNVQRGNNYIAISGLGKHQPGIYFALVQIGGQVLRQKIFIAR